ncbi:hypothetical protein ADUPG1_010194 [Aduncisulcus paluster]|uniref:Uncharacterized protein n=1 Tax=Aduncisulcus paluster TaxID=2918883 RepID=A0ABQ5JU59_9EUKA|nr:hypothetical protein ADUPG1_010194 [Aduncisulcus paluster]
MAWLLHDYCMFSWCSLSSIVTHTYICIYTYEHLYPGQHHMSYINHPSHLFYYTLSLDMTVLLGASWFFPCSCFLAMIGPEYDQCKDVRAILIIHSQPTESVATDIQGLNG